MTGNIQSKLGRLSAGHPESKPGGDRVWDRLRELQQKQCWPRNQSPFSGCSLFRCPGPETLFWVGLQAKASVASGRIAGEGGGKEACSQWWVGNAYELIKFTQTALSQLCRQEIEKGAQWKTSIVPTHLTVPVTWKQQQLKVLKAAVVWQKKLWLWIRAVAFPKCMVTTSLSLVFPPFQMRCNGPCWLPTPWLPSLSFLTKPQYHSGIPLAQGGHVFQRNQPSALSSEGRELMIQQS